MKRWKKKRERRVKTIRNIDNYYEEKLYTLYLEKSVAIIKQIVVEQNFIHTYDCI